MNTIINRILPFILLLPVLLFATVAQENASSISQNDDALAVFYTIDGDAQEQYNTLVQNKLKSIGFNLSDPHKRVNEQYKTKYGSTILDVLSFMPVVNDEVILPLLNIDPRIAGFAPFNMLIYKKLDENKTHVGHLMPKIMLNILGIEDKEVREKFSATFQSLDSMIEKELGGEKSYMPYKSLPEQKMINFEYEFEAPEDIDDFIDAFQNKFELAFIDKGYLIAGYHNFMESTEDAEEILSDYDAFWTYSLCHLKFSYHMFDNEGARPEAGLFAPCTMYMYIKKGTNKLVVGMFRLHNWSETLEITDESRLSLVEQLDSEIPEILTAFGMKAVPNVNPPKAAAKVSAPKKEPVVEEKPIVTNKAEAVTVPDIPVPENALAVMYTLEGNIEKQYNSIVDDELKKVGYEVTDPHYRVNDQYENKYGSTVLDTLSFLSVVNDKAILPLLNIDPRIASTAPFNMLIYKTLDENVSHVGHIMPKAFLDMIGIEEKEVRDAFIASISPLDTKLEEEFRAKGLKYTKSYKTYKKLPETRMHTFQYEFEAPEDMDEFIEEFQNKFELAFIDKGYLIAGYHNFMEGLADAEDILEGYDAFWTYSLCHLEFSYNVFDNKGARPDAGLFAPCTMYVYIKKGSNKMIVGMLRLENWSTSLDINDQSRVDLVNRLDNEIPEVLTAFGMKAVTNTNTLKEICKIVPTQSAPSSQKELFKVVKASQKEKPVVEDNQTQGYTIQCIETSSGKVNISIPSVPEVPVAHQSQDNIEILDRSIKFSKRVPPNYVPHRFDKKKRTHSSKNTRIGEVNQGRISAYLRGKFTEVKDVENKLKGAGFEVLATVPVDKKKELISIVFTDKSLAAMGSKANKGFIASLRALVDTKEKTFSIMNPLYMAKGYLQADYDESAAKTILVKLIEAFPGLKNSKDALKFQLLPKYQFMNGMPRYEDMIEVASGNDLLEKLTDNKSVAFIQTLENGSTLAGINLSKRTLNFTKRIGRNNAAMLPYPVLIENGKAKILDPKYYIAYMYPLLQMTEFMTIATIPDAMIKDCKRAFKQKKKKK